MRFGANFKIQINCAGTAPSSGAIWDEFIGQQQGQSIKKYYISNF